MSDFLEKWAESSESNSKVCAREDLIVDVTEDILVLMESRDIKKSDLAETLGKSRSVVTQVLNGTRNMTLGTLSDICFALNVKPDVRLVTREGVSVNGSSRCYNWETEEYDPRHKNVSDFNKHKDRKIEVAFSGLKAFG